MEQDLRARLADELAEAAEPPIGDLVGAALRHGRRLRTARRLRFAGANVAVVAAVAALGYAVARPGGEAPVTVAAPATSAAAGDPASQLQLLLSLLPAGRTSHYMVDAERPMLQTYLDSGAGPGMLRVTVTKVAPGEPMWKGHYGDGIDVTGPTALPGGYQLLVLRIPDNCIQSTVVQVRHPDGTQVQVNIATCLSWDGQRNPPAPAALTVEQATRIAIDGRWALPLPPVGPSVKPIG